MSDIFVTDAIATFNRFYVSRCAKELKLLPCYEPTEIQAALLESSLQATAGLGKIGLIKPKYGKSP